MRPLKLEFEGINSFSEHTIIDFEVLTKNGIFGIFGDTGSGKSTILDCINFALYGNVERSREKTDIINYKCSSATVKFVFNIINEGKRKTYTVERTIKKDKSGTHKAALYENDGERELCIADKTTQVVEKITQILGVEADDFRKCIALPQGEFAQFVQSAPRERLALIERLFSLSKYGDRLREKIAAKEKETEYVYQNLLGRIQAYDGITLEAFARSKDCLEAAKGNLQAFNKQYELRMQEREQLKKLYAVVCELEDIKIQLARLAEQSSQIEELRKSYSSLSDCREVVKLDSEACKKTNEINTLNKDAIAFKDKYGSESVKLSNLESQMNESNFDEEIANCVSIGAVHSANSGNTKKLEIITAELQIKRDEYAKKEKELLKLKADYTVAAGALVTAEKSLEEVVGADIEKIINVEFKGAVLRDEYIYNLDYFAQFNGGIKVYKEKSPLYDYVSGEIESKIKEYKQRIADVKDCAFDRVEERLENFRQNEKGREKRQRLVNDCKLKVQKLENEISLKLKELEISKKDGLELRARAEEVKKELENAFGANCDDYAAVIDANQKKLKVLKERRDELIKSLEKLKNSVNNLQLSVERIKTLEVSAQSELHNIKKSLDEKLKLCGCNSIQDCKTLVERFEKVTDVEATIKDFDSKFAALTLRKCELEKTVDLNSFSDEKLHECNIACNKLDEDIKKLTGEIAVLSAECKNFEIKLAEKKKLLDEFEKVEKERGLVSRLKDVTKGNKFLEYIANEYLCDISSLASSTLLKLKDGRYFLTYKDNNFYVGDNFNCGNLRGVNTLSGGETFLVSLSLALALSQTICAKSLKSIEFFFLDEGFGTLDSSLVDTVMNALEKLKSSSFTIGVISHVEELKSRIDSKITVNKATENHGSFVSISC